MFCAVTREISDHSESCQKPVHWLPIIVGLLFPVLLSGLSLFHSSRHDGWECRDRIIFTLDLALVGILSGDILDQIGEGWLSGVSI